MQFLETLTPIDWGILGIVAAAITVGWVKGIIRFLTGFLSFILAVILAGRFSGPVLQWINERWDLQGRIEDGLHRRLQLPSGMTDGVLDRVGIPQPYKQPLALEAARMSADGGLSPADYVIQQIAAGVSNAIVFMVLALLLSVAISWIGKFFAERVQEIPLVGTADRLLGAAAIGLEAVLILAILLVFVLPTLSIYGMTALDEAVGQSVTPVYIIRFFEVVRWLLLGGGIQLWNA